MRLTLQIIVLGLLTGCVSKPSDPVIDGAAFEQMFNSNQENYIKLGCTYLSTALEPLAKLSGIYCASYPDETTVLSFGKELVSENRNRKILWKKNNFYVHHKLKISKIGDELLVLTSDYHKGPSDKLRRFDVLNVVSKKGELLKRFSFYDYYLENGYSAPDVLNEWSTDGFQLRSTENTHMNSFSELYDIKNGKKILTGYIAHCVYLRKIFVFDNSLKIVSTISTEERRLHDVKQYRPGQLIMFVNFDGQAADPRSSHIDIYDFNSKTFSHFYSSQKIKKTFDACGSVQVLPDDQLFIFYSACVQPKNKTGKLADSYFEIVDLKTKKSELKNIFEIQQSAYVMNRLPEIW